MVKKLSEIKVVGIVGAGTMGQGIAQVIAMAGYKVLLYDVNAEKLEAGLKHIEENLQKGVELGKVAGEEKDKYLQNIELTNDIRTMVADIVIEAIVEKLEVKVQLFEELEKLNASYTILATNTSSIPITQMAARLKHPERLIGMHFFNPAYIMKLVEVISGLATSNEVVELIKEFAVQLGKVPVVAKDSPGFIVNRVARHYYVESLKILEENIADIKTIDRLMESSGFKMGPFRLMDLIGIDTNFSVTNSMYNAFHQDPKFRPSRLQQQKVDAGHYGKKSGKGFYEY